MRAEGYAVESILRVLRQQGLSIAARTYRSLKHPARVADRTVTDALVEDKIRELAWTFNATIQRWHMTPEGLYGRRKWVALLRRQEGLAGTSRGAVDRAMRTLGLEGIRRAKKLRTTIPNPDAKRAGDLLNRDFTAPAPNLVWVTGFTYVRTWAGFVYVAFVVDVFAQRIVGWHASSTHAHRSRHDATTDRAVAAGTRRKPGLTRLFGGAQRCRIAVHVDPVHRAPRPRGHRSLDRDRRRCVR